MVWKYETGDLYDLETLEGFRVQFEKTVASHQKDLDYAKSFEKYGIPNWRTEVIRREVGLDIAKTNLMICIRAIQETKQRLGV